MLKKFGTELFIVVGVLLFLFVCLFILSQLRAPFKAKVAYAKVNGAKISYYTRGEGDPIILLSGFGMTMQDWDPLLLEKLSLDHKLILLDYRGVGSSTGSLAKLSQKQMVDDVVGLMGQLKIKKATILGWSLGSFIAQVIAEQHPAQVSKLILIGTGPGGDQQLDASEEVSATIQTNLAGTWEDVYVPLMFASGEAKDAYLDRLYIAQGKKEVPKGPEESLDAKNAQEKIFGDDMQEYARLKGLSKIKAPTLIIGGDQDKLLIPENAAITAKLIPHAKLKTIANAGHAVLFEKSQEVVQDIETFLSQ